MRLSTTNSPLSPDEFQRQLADFVKQHFQQAGKNVPGDVPQAEQSAGAGAESHKGDADDKRDDQSGAEESHLPSNYKGCKSETNPESH